MQVSRLLYFQEAGLWVAEVRPSKKQISEVLDWLFPGLNRGCYQYELGSTQIFLTSWHVIAFSQMSSNMVRCSQSRGPPPELKDLHQNWASEAPHLLPVRCQTHKQNKAIFFIKLGCLWYFMTKSRNIKQNQMDELSVAISSKHASFCLLFLSTVQNDIAAGKKELILSSVEGLSSIWGKWHLWDNQNFLICMHK